MFSIKDIIKITGITKRTLHYYDEQGILTPSKNSENNYREYNKKDLIKLQEILFLKAIGLSLKEIKEYYLLDNEKRTKILLKHKENLKYELLKLQNTIEKLDKVIDGKDIRREILEGEKVNNMEKQYEREIELLYSNSSEYRIYKHNTKDYTKEDFKNLEKELDHVYRNIVENIDELAESKVIQNEIASLYDIMYNLMGCSKEIFYSICLSYKEDCRFNSYFEKFGEESLVDLIIEAAKIYKEK
ncbi:MULTISPECIES: MerR family transcriptional regulator [unclassified Gemella]|uniref:MerR family transcriptional regulator n=1 Tax=unclassified Gemella TaxID=2624949 RepID=UPI001430E654|nr:MULTISPECIES: MerR family transcriptional regulator [unclassified Gemella]MBF0710410.1 MerR family transcriptional regulator [Gemella sp. GL1.1]MBF0747048.1 MerR family transcriptional regulator [Gemella sp. 19428wG2_WT2a]NYS27754.1 MerR family transcriptional regulator [Gemella sp. GL1]